MEKAKGFESARELLENKNIDLAILDIMGVDGYGMLEIANKKKITAIMLTAHAFSPENTAKSYKRGAASCIPKDLMANIQTYLNDVLEVKQAKKSSWWRWKDPEFDPNPDSEMKSKKIMIRIHACFAKRDLSTKSFSHTRVQNLSWILSSRPGFSHFRLKVLIGAFKEVFEAD